MMRFNKILDSTASWLVQEVMQVSGSHFTEHDVSIQYF